MTESICADITCKLADKGSVTIVDSFGNADNEIRSFSKLFFYVLHLTGSRPYQTELPEDK